MIFKDTSERIYVQLTQYFLPKRKKIINHFQISGLYIKSLMDFSFSFHKILTNILKSTQFNEYKNVKFLIKLRKAKQQNHQQMWKPKF